MGALKSRFWSDGSPKDTLQERIAKYCDIPLDAMKIEYSAPRFSLTDKPLNNDKFDEALRLHPEPQQVEVLQLRHVCMISSIPVSITLYTGLCELDLQENQITKIPWSLVSLRNTLQKLNLRYNELEYIPRFIGRLVKLTDLDVSHNKIEDLPSDMLDLTSLVTLNIDHNQFLNWPSVEVCKRGKDAIFQALLERSCQRRNVWRATTTMYIPGHESDQPQSLLDLSCRCIIDYEVAYTEPEGTLPKLLEKHLTQMKESFTYITLAKCNVCNNYFSSKDKFDRHSCW